MKKGEREYIVLTSAQTDHPEHWYRSAKKFNHIKDAREYAKIYDVTIWRVFDNGLSFAQVD